ncbi:LacI family transcriptional regulator [Clostridia bacterium]|nr:LacI family transcriptional regulator [Clostridia bacterium]
MSVKKIAQLSGVSRGTVDRVLNHRGKVKPSTQERVMAAVDALGYQPNLLAKSLATKGARGFQYIGVLVSADGNPFFDDVLKGVSGKMREIEDFGFKMLLETDVRFDAARQLEVIDKLAERGIQGLIISPVNHPDISRRLTELRRGGLPVVCVNTDVEDRTRDLYVGSDYHRCGRVAAELFGLLADGRAEKLAIIPGSLMVLGHDLRVRGFKSVAQWFENLTIVDVRENHDNDELSYRVTRDILTRNPDLTGIFFCAAGIGGGLKALEEFGKLGVIRVVTVDLIDVVRQNMMNYNITATICQEPEKQGREAVSVMFDMLLTGRGRGADIVTETQVMLKNSLL